MANAQTLSDEMTAIFDASCIVANACGNLTSREGIEMLTRVHARLRNHHQELRYLDSFEHDIAIERIKLEYE